MNQTTNETVKEQSTRTKFGDSTLLLILAVFNVILHSLFNHNYGFHRDELATVDDAQHLAWGYVAYPPLTPFVGRIAFELFGESLTGLRFFAVLAISVGIVLTGLAARELGASRSGRLLAAMTAPAVGGILERFSRVRLILSGIESSEKFYESNSKILRFGRRRLRRAFSRRNAEKAV